MLIIETFISVSILDYPFINVRNGINIFSKSGINKHLIANITKLNTTTVFIISLITI